MVLELALGLGITFLIIVAGSYIGAKMALNSFFGRDFSPSEMEQGTSADTGSDEPDQDAPSDAPTNETES